MAVKEAWFGFGLDPVVYTIVILGVAATKEEAEAKSKARLDHPEVLAKAPDISAWTVVNILDRDGIQGMKDWLIACKVPRHEIPWVMNRFLQLLKKIVRGKHE